MRGVDRGIVELFRPHEIVFRPRRRDCQRKKNSGEQQPILQHFDRSENQIVCACRACILNGRLNGSKLAASPRRACNCFIRLTDQPSSGVHARAVADNPRRDALSEPRATMNPHSAGFAPRLSGPTGIARSGVRILDKSPSAPRCNCFRPRGGPGLIANFGIP
jgi:hypothetical protein